MLGGGGWRGGGDAGRDSGRGARGRVAVGAGGCGGGRNGGSGEGSGEAWGRSAPEVFPGTGLVDDPMLLQVLQPVAELQEQEAHPLLPVTLGPLWCQAVSRTKSEAAQGAPPE